MLRFLAQSLEPLGFREQSWLLLRVFGFGRRRAFGFPVFLVSRRRVLAIDPGCLFWAVCFGLPVLVSGLGGSKTGRG